MKVTILVDNNKLNKDLKIVKGFSSLVEDEGKRILFDTGLHGEIIHNAKVLNVDLSNLDYLVFSHGHDDHVGGAKDVLKMYKNEIKKPKIIACEGFFNSRYDESPSIEIGAKELENFIKSNFECILTTEPYKITNNLTFLGKIDRSIDFEGKNPLGKVKKNGKYEDDYIDDDSGLVYKTEDGIVVISGCAHSGICNMVKQAKKIANDERVVDVIGGTHLLNSSAEIIEKTAKWLRDNGVETVHVCHCTENAVNNLKEVIDCEETGSGLVLEY